MQDVKALCLLLFTPFYVCFSGCTSMLAGSGSAASKPAGAPKMDMETCREVERRGVKKPVCFSCDQAIKILNAKQRLKRWPERCRKEKKHLKKVFTVECRKKLKKERANTNKCRKKQKTILKSWQKQSASAKVAEVVRLTLVGAGAFAVGILGGYLLFKFLPAP